jgi:nicotinate-nucleotide pyrophosphorylase
VRKRLTPDAIEPENHTSKAIIMAKADGVMAAHWFALEVFKFLDRGIQYKDQKQDGGVIIQGDILAVIMGKSRAILTGERVALNILQRLSGIARKSSIHLSITEIIRCLMLKSICGSLVIINGSDTYETGMR